jgi:hypothetical protein
MISMAKGWESKSVEEQQAEFSSVPGPRKAPLSPADLKLQQQRDGLLLSRKRILQQLEAAHNPHHRKVLEDALAGLDERLARPA